METVDKLQKIRNEVNAAADRVNYHLLTMEDTARELERLAQIASHADEMIDSISNEFAKATGLTGKDMNFLFVAIALQCIRQYVIDQLLFRRKPHDETEKGAHDLQNNLWNTDENKKAGKEGKQNSTWYWASNEEILFTYGVPYDVVSGTKKFGVGGSRDTGVSGTNHRVKTLGHDPLYGWVFGTGNIMTNTLTNYAMNSYHVKSGKVVEYANTSKMLTHMMNRSLERPKDFGLCIIKEGLHLASDVFSYEGIPLPGIERWLSPDKAAELAEYGLDFGNSIKNSMQSSAAVLINMLIAMIHRLTRDDSVDTDGKLYEVKTRKILLYSNCIASTSNVIATAVGTISGVCSENPEVVKQSIKNLDVGGLVVTMHRIVKDTAFIQQVKEEFLEKEYYDMVIKEL